MDKKEYIQKHLDELFQFWLYRAGLWGSAVFILLGMLDYISTPENFKTFLVYRAIIAPILLVISFTVKKTSNRYLHKILAYISIIASAAVIELMILQFGGHASPYYAGMILLGICVLGFLPERFYFHAVIALIIYAIYLFPIIMTEHITDVKTFFTANAFMSLVFFSALILKYISAKGLIKELSLKYDLEQHKEHLETLVQERTFELSRAVNDLKNEIAERKKAEEAQQRLQSELLQAQKMESIGRLAGGIAHDFNNILSTILGYCEMVQDELSENKTLKAKVKIISDAGERAAKLVQQLMAFSRKQVLAMQAVNLNIIVENMAQMLNRIIGENISLVLHINSDIKNVMADAGQIEQVLMNLAVNAKDAMPSGGRLIIETSDILIDEDCAVRHEGVRPGAYVMLSVSDTGVGMSKEVQEKIFEPFFTTKELGKGTGFGLATVYGIVKQHNGHIWLYSEIGKGTTFKIYLPATQKIKSETKKFGTPAMLQGSETVLIVEDEPSIRKMIVDTLKPLGYHVLEADSGEEALKVSDSFDGQIDLLLTDVIMTGMNGKELSDILSSKRHGIKVIFMSGYTDEAIAYHGVLNAGVVVIQKPITPSKMLNKIRDVLNNK